MKAVSSGSDLIDAKVNVLLSKMGFWIIGYVLIMPLTLCWAYAYHNIKGIAEKTGEMSLPMVKALIFGIWRRESNGSTIIVINGSGRDPLITILFEHMEYNDADKHSRQYYGGTLPACYDASGSIIQLIEKYWCPELYFRIQLD